MPFAITIHEDGTAVVGFEMQVACPDYQSATALTGRIRTAIDDLGKPYAGAYITTVTDHRADRREAMIASVVRANKADGIGRDEIRTRMCVLLGDRDEEGLAMVDEILADLFDEHPEDCLYCAAGEPMRHNYEPPREA